MVRSQQDHQEHRMETKNMRSKLLIASICAGLLAGSGIAAARIVDNPPGSGFQTQMIQEGLEGVRAYAYILVPAVPRHKVVRHHRR